MKFRFVFSLSFFFVVLYKRIVERRAVYIFIFIFGLEYSKVEFKNGTNYMHLIIIINNNIIIISNIIPLLIYDYIFIYYALYLYYFY